MSQKYLHGYSEEEQNRLITQNEVLSPMIYQHIDLSKVRHLLEYGCGVGAQMAFCLKKYPDIKITGVDISPDQLAKAKTFLAEQNINPKRYQLLTVEEFHETTIIFDGLLMVWLLEHLTDPLDVLKKLKNRLTETAYVSITEVFNDTLIVRPKSESIELIWDAINNFQEEQGGNGNIGRSTTNMLQDAGYKNIVLKPYPIIASDLHPDFKELMFTYWLGLMESSVLTLIDQKFVTPDLWSKAKEDIIHLKNEKGSTFFYCFMQAFANI